MIDGPDISDLSDPTEPDRPMPVGISDDPHEQDLLGYAGSEVDLRAFDDPKEKPTYTIKVRCGNCGWEGTGRQSRGKGFTDSTHWSTVDCPWCGCDRVINDA